MFRLVDAINDWKRSVRQGESLSESNVLELESHLNEAIADLMGKGLTEEEAFLVAARRLGDHAALSQEFGKVNGTTIWSRRIPWLLVGYVGGTALASGISGLSTCVGTLSAYVGYGGAVTGLAGVATGLASWVVVILWLYFGMRRSEQAPARDVTSAGWLAVWLAIMVAGACLGLVGQNAHAQIAPMDQFTLSMWWKSMGGFVMHGCLVAICVGVILATRERSSLALALDRD